MEISLVPNESVAIVVSKNWDIRTDIVEYLEDLRIASLMTNCVEDVPYLFLADYQPGYIFVGIDEFGGAAIMYDALKEMRERMPNTSIILVSREFETSEFGTHRLPLADVCLRYPLSKSNLFLAIQQAPINLGIWKRRQASLHKPPVNRRSNILHIAREAQID